MGADFVDPLGEAGMTHLPKGTVARTKVERDAGDGAALVGASRFEAIRGHAKQGSQTCGQRHGRVSERVFEERDRLTGMAPQGLGDDLRLAAGKEVVNGADRRSAARDELFDAGSCKAAFPKQRLGRLKHPFPTPRLTRRHGGII